MELLVIANLNGSLSRAKIQPLVASDWVTRLVWVSPRAHASHPKLDHVIVPDEGGVVRRNLALLHAAVTAVRKRRPDLIMAYNVVPYGLIAYSVSRLFRIPLGIHVIGGPLELEGGGYQTENRLLSALPGPSASVEKLMFHVVRAASVVTTTGTRTKQYLSERRVAPDRIFAVSSVIDPQRFRPEPRARRYDIVCISALIPRKRIEMLLELAADLRQRHPGLQVAILGDGPLRPELEAHIARLGLGETVHLLGFCEDVCEVLWSSRIFVMTSFLEGLPLSLMEAMACGLAPVVGDFGDVTDLVEDGVTGRIVPTNDRAEYLDALHELLDNEPLRARLADAAVATVHERYTVRAATARWREVYVAALRALERLN